MLGSLAAAILLTVLAESRRFRPPSRAAPLLSWGALVCCCGVCVGLVAGVLVYVLRVHEWLAVTIALPVAIPVLWGLAKMMDS
jgi:ABC-type glucose/galactose transport system permease subunit